MPHRHSSNSHNLSPLTSPPSSPSRPPSRIPSPQSFHTAPSRPTSPVSVTVPAISPLAPSTSTAAVKTRASPASASTNSTIGGGFGLTSELALEPRSLPTTVRPTFAPPGINTDVDVAQTQRGPREPLVQISAENIRPTLSGPVGSSADMLATSDPMGRVRGSIDGLGWGSEFTFAVPTLPNVISLLGQRQGERAEERGLGEDGNVNGGEHQRSIHQGGQVRRSSSQSPPGPQYQHQTALPRQHPERHPSTPAEEFRARHTQGGSDETEEFGARNRGTVNLTESPMQRHHGGGLVRPLTNYQPPSVEEVVDEEWGGRNWRVVGEPEGDMM
ncbi:hypothetical protein K432DRAFT_391493 [Lepidopterella palustris CBS 459.81]|uniref:Uncharacterized protein n=1 Tax=Lepidopterella palustris CBS 459.81 TaxID=1314670 RepID=A0A8E2JH67_9PEZI|nr:hypothetical protein K432DRAFT_391493 [Lepidopterella palustris CBS 459.81]